MVQSLNHRGLRGFGGPVNNGHPQFRGVVTLDDLHSGIGSQRRLQPSTIICKRFFEVNKLNSSSAVGRENFLRVQRLDGKRASVEHRDHICVLDTTSATGNNRSLTISICCNLLAHQSACFHLKFRGQPSMHTQQYAEEISDPAGFPLDSN